MQPTQHVIGLCDISPPDSCAATWQIDIVLVPPVVPNGVSTGLDIGLSNSSLMLITLSFYTMCKSSTPVFLLLFAFLWGIERCAAVPIVLYNPCWYLQ